MLEYRGAVGHPRPYLVVPASSDGAENGRRAQAVAAQPTTIDAEQRGQHERAGDAAGVIPNPPAEPGGDARPNGQAHPPRKADAEAHARQTAEALYGPDNGRAPQPAPPLKYGDGSPVDEDNNAEVQTFRRFLAEKKAAPASRAALQAYYRQRVAVH
jgi:hypothetical protein